MTIKVEVLGGDAPPEVMDVIRKLFGGGDTDEAKKARSESAQLKAQGWTDDDICMLNGAIQLTTNTGRLTMDNLMHASLAHHSLTAARAALGLATWCAHCCTQIDHAARLLGDPKGDHSGRQEYWREALEHAQNEVKRLEQAEELRQSVAHVH